MRRESGQRERGCGVDCWCWRVIDGLDVGFESERAGRLTGLIVDGLGIDLLALRVLGGDVSEVG